MELGKVVGQVIATVRDVGVPPVPLLLVDLIDSDGNTLRCGQVATDVLGAGEGEIVLLVRGSSARFTMDSQPPLDLSVVAIVDQVTASGEVKYNK